MPARRCVAGWLMPRYSAKFANAAEDCGSSVAILFRGEIERSFLGEGVGVLREPAAALCLFFQGSQAHASSTGHA
jgi:hypothetical protein